MDDEPVWQSEEWQEARSRLLEDTCRQCHSTEKLSLVHLWKPPRYRTVRLKVEQEIIDKLVEEEKSLPFDPNTADSDEIREACPSCDSINLRKRKTKTPKYKCGRCNSAFDQPKSVTVRDEFIYQKKYQEWKEERLEGYEKELEQKIETIRQEFDKKYRSGEGTTTMCGKCSYLFTQKNMTLCKECGEKYHKRRYDVCYSCYQETDLVTCEKCNEVKITPQPGGINICEYCYEKMWEELTE